MNPTTGLDGWLFAQVNSFARATPALHGGLYAYATYGEIVFAVLLVAGWWLARSEGTSQRVAAAGWAVIGTLLAVELDRPILAAVHEPRPYSTLPHILVLAARDGASSFPSDHATMAGAAAAALFLVHRALGWVSAAAAVLLAFARVYVAANYPQDVLAGLLLGAAIVLAGYVLLRRVLVRGVDALRGTPLRMLVAANGVVPSAPPAPRS